MRRFLLFSNALVVIVFTGVFAFTFWAREPMEHSARAALLADAQKRTTPLVDSAEAALNSGLTQKLMTESQRATIQAEITEFRTHPTAVIEKIITSAGETAAVQAARDKASRFNPVLKKLEAWKDGLRDWYEKSLARLMIDVRVFAGTNVIAGFLAFLIVWFAPRAQFELLMFSLVLLISTGLSLWFYIDSFSLWRFALRSSAEWWYPGFVGSLFCHLWFSETAKRLRRENRDRRHLSALSAPHVRMA